MNHPNKKIVNLFYENQLYDTKIYPEGKDLWNAGSISNNIFYIHSGIVKVYYFDENYDRYITVAFYSKGEILMPFNSIFKNLPERYEVQVIKDAKMSVISKQNWEKIMEKEPELMKLVYEFTLDTLNKFADYICKNSYSNEERFQMLMQEMPYLEEVTDLNIAEHLCASRETVNHIRVKLRKKNKKK